MSGTGMMYVRVIAGDVVVIDVDDAPGAEPQEVYRITRTGKESWLNGDWLALSRQLVGDEATHHPADSVIGRAAQKIYAAVTREAVQAAQGGSLPGDGTSHSGVTRPS